MDLYLAKWSGIGRNDRWCYYVDLHLANGLLTAQKQKTRPPLFHTKVAVSFREFWKPSQLPFDFFRRNPMVICKKQQKQVIHTMGERIASLRRHSGLSQSALAHTLGLSTSTIAMYEQGRRQPSISIIIALADALGVTIHYLLTGQPAQETFSQSPAIAARANLVNTLLHALL